MWHVETDFFALALFAVMIYKNRRFWGGDTNRDRTFLSLLVVGTITTLLDIVASLAMNGLGGWWFYQISMSLYAGTQTVPTVAWLAYMFTVVYDETWSRTRRRIQIAVIPCAVAFLIALSNPVTGLFFTLTPEMAYARGPLFIPLGFGLYGIYMITAVIILVTNRRRIIPKSNTYLMASFFLVSLVAIVVQLANPGWLITQSAYAVSFVLCDATMEERNRKDLYRRIQEQNISLTEAMGMAEIASNARDEFFSRVSHDMRTPMNGILGLSELALEEDDPEVVKRDIVKIRESGEYMLGLINDTLDIQRSESGNMKLEPQNMDGRAFMESLIDMIRPTAEAKNLVFHTEGIDTCTGVEIYADPLRLKQIFVNLLSNSVKFTPAGGQVTLRVEQLAPTDSTYRCHVLIDDTGTGMSEKFMKSGLYRPFSQEHNDMSDQAAGSGLGLSIVKHLIDQMNGRIEVSSTLGVGTTFSIFLEFPKATSDDSKIPGHSDGLLPGNGLYTPRPGTRILLCEDNALNAEIANRLLGRIGYQVDIAVNGRDGVKLLSESPVGYFSAILMDIRMPVMDGREAALAIRSLDRDDAMDIPIIAMTADAFDQDKELAAAAGMDAYISKPVDPELLYMTLADQITRKSASDAL